MNEFLNTLLTDYNIKMFFIAFGAVVVTSLILFIPMAIFGSLAEYSMRLKDNIFYQILRGISWCGLVITGPAFVVSSFIGIVMVCLAVVLGIFAGASYVIMLFL